MVVNDLEPERDGADIVRGRIEAAPSRYPVNLRCTIPFYPRPLFLTLIIGREKRGPERLRAERERHPIDTWGNIAFAFSMGGVASITLMFLMMWVIGVPA